MKKIIKLINKKEKDEKQNEKKKVPAIISSEKSFKD